MHIPDLSPYRHHECDDLVGVLAVGWLSKAHAFTEGPVSPLLLKKLTLLAIFKSINFTREGHRCDFCGIDFPAAEDGGIIRLLGSAEIWIPGQNVLYAAPNLIVHYVAVHRYLPPDAFLRSLESLDVDEWSPPRDYLSIHRYTRVSGKAES